MTTDSYQSNRSKKKQLRRQHRNYRSKKNPWDIPRKNLWRSKGHEQMADRNVKGLMPLPAICEVSEEIGSYDNDLNRKVEEGMRMKMEKISLLDIQPSIYRVHKKLRDVNEKAYEPVILAIGPYHRGNKKLQMMEEHKWRYLKALLDHRPDLKFENFISAIAEKEQLARKYYAEPVDHITSAEFIEMLVLDGCFIIRLVQKCNPEYSANINANDPIFHSLWILDNLIGDMMLFENQIPFFVLCKLFDLIQAPNQHNLLINLVLYFFGGSFPGADATNSTSHDGKRDKLFDRLTGPIFNLFIKKRCPGAGTSSSSVTHVHNLLYDDEPQNVMHILDLLHSKWTRTSKINDDDDDDDDTQVEGDFKFIQSATDLRDANVKFQVSSEHNTMFDIVFNKGSLSIPPLKISDRTECTLRNLIVFEQYFPHDRPTSFTAYARFMDCLINSSADATFLSQRGIIHNWMGDNEVVAKVFNEITDSVSLGTNFAYAKTFHLINTHYHRKKNRAIANLKRNYFNSPWAYISFLAALLLLSLTIAQTVLSALQLG